MQFPEFSEYHDSFARELSPAIFANFIKPSWVPKPNVLLRISQIIYPHWRERRLDRQGHRIIPTLNVRIPPFNGASNVADCAFQYDETDTQNESYICFRRREIKSVRKTRASQISSSDKLARLQTEMAHPVRISQLLRDREKVKAEASFQGEQVWASRLDFVELKAKFKSLNDPADEVLLVDKERPTKKQEAYVFFVVIGWSNSHTFVTGGPRPTNLLVTILQLQAPVSWWKSPRTVMRGFRPRSRLHSQPRNLGISFGKIQRLALHVPPFQYHSL